MNEQMKAQRIELEYALMDAFESGHAGSAYLALALKAHALADHVESDEVDRADCLRFAHRATRLALGFLEGDLESMGVDPCASGKCVNPPNRDGGAHHGPAVER
jgi:hypothetical protein